MTSRFSRRDGESGEDEAASESNALREFMASMLLGLAGWLWLGVFATAAEAVSLANLFAGGTLTAGNARFTNWELVSLDETSPPFADLALVDVTPLVDGPLLNPGVRFDAGSQLQVSGINALDLHLKFRAEALGGTSSFVGQTLAVTGATFSGGSGRLFISGDLTSGSESLSATLVFLDNGTPPVVHPSDTTSFVAKSGLDVVLNAFLTGIGPLDDVSLGVFTQRFAQTGPPGLFGDYNDDGSVNAADYTVYRNRRSGIGGNTLINEFATQGLVTADDYLFWKTQYGAGVGTGSVQSGAAADVPEPATWLLLIGMMVGVAGRRRVRLFRIATSV